MSKLLNSLLPDTHMQKQPSPCLISEEKPLHLVPSLSPHYSLSSFLFFSLISTIDFSRLLSAAGAKVLGSPWLSFTCRTDGKVGKENPHWLQVLPQSYNVAREDLPLQFRGRNPPWPRHVCFVLILAVMLFWDTCKYCICFSLGISV